MADETELYFQLTLTELSTSFGVQSETIIEIINEGIINARQDEQGEWHFDAESISTVRTVLHLNRDLGVNMAGAALALDLMREIEALKARLPKFEL